VGSLASVLQAESLEKTFTVAVSNAVTHHIEMVPTTFRYGATNGGVERLEDNRFVAVPFVENPSFQTPWKPPSKMWLALSNRLHCIQLPPIKIESTSMSKAIGMIEKIIQDAEGTTNAPLKLSYYQDKRETMEDEYIVPMDLPATNAFALVQLLKHQQALGKCSRECKKKSINGFEFTSDSHDSPANNLPACCKKQGKPVIRSQLNLKDGEEIVSLFGEIDVCSYIRVFAVPNRFFKCYPTEEHIKAAVEAKIGLTNQFGFGFCRQINCLRVDHGGSAKYGRTPWEQLTYFEEQMLLPFYQSSATWTKTCVSVGDGDERILFAYASDDGSFGGIWRYCAVKGKDGVLRDRFVPCPIPLGFVDVEGLNFIAHGEGLDAAGEIKKECFIYTTHQGNVFRFDGQQFIQIDTEWQVPQETPKSSAHLEREYPLLKSTVFPEVDIPKGMPFTNALAYIEQLTNLYGPDQENLSRNSLATNRRIRIVLGKTASRHHDYSSSKKPSQAALSTNNFDVCPAISARFISLRDVLFLITGLYDLHPYFDQKEATIELMDYATYFRKASREKEYLLPARVGVKMPNLQDWERLFYEEYQIPRKELTIVSCSPLERGVLKIRVIPGPWSDLVDDIIQVICTRYSGRFKLERHVRDGGIRLAWIDRDTDTEQFYRTQYDRTGKRTERFELPESVIP
jgi:hypothetical protein